MLFICPITALLATTLAVAPFAYADNIAVTVAPAGDHVFQPTSITANVGDVVVFTWDESDHTATEAVGPNPLQRCLKKAGGFDSLLKKKGENFTFTVISTQPVYVYCKPHCLLEGMRMTINAPLAEPEEVTTASNIQAYISDPILVVFNFLKFF